MWQKNASGKMEVWQVYQVPSTKKYVFIYYYIIFLHFIAITLSTEPLPRALSTKVVQ